MPTQDWYRPGKGYLRRDAAKFLYTKRNIKMQPPFSCSQKLGYCDTNGDFLPDRILKKYRSPALKKKYQCPPLPPWLGPDLFSGFVVPPVLGPSIVTDRIKVPEFGPSDLLSDVLPPAGISNLNAKQKEPEAVTNLSTEVNKPTGVSDLLSELSPPAGISNLSTETETPGGIITNLTSEIELPSGITNLNTDLNLPAGISNLSTETETPGGILSNLSAKVEAPSSIDNLTTEVPVPELGVSDLTADVYSTVTAVSNLNAAVAKPSAITNLDASYGPHTAPTFDETSGVTSFNAGAGYLVIPINVGTAASTWKFHLNAATVPDRFQILYDTSGVSNLIDDCDIVADSLYVGDALSPTSPTRTTYQLSPYVYVGSGGSHFNGTFNQYETTPKSITITDLDCAPGGNRTTSVPNGPRQFGVQNLVYVTKSSFSLDLPYSDGNICLTFSKPVSVANRAYLIITGTDTNTISSLIKIEKILL